MLTWDQAGPRGEVSDKVERAANVFASSLLLPAEAVRAEVERLDGEAEYLDLIQIAREFDVSTEALLWRLVNLEALSRSQVEEVLSDPEFRRLDRAERSGRRPLPLSPPERFAVRAFTAHKKGRLSRMKLAEYLACDLVSLTDRLAEYGLEEDGAYDHRLPSP